jgi:hypothetical protein
MNGRQSETSGYTKCVYFSKACCSSIASNKGGGKDFRIASFGTRLDSLTGESLHSPGEGS